MSNNHTHVVDLNKAKARELEQSAIQNARVNPETPVKSVLLNLAIVAWIKLLLWFESCVKKVNTIKNYTQEAHVRKTPREYQDTLMTF